MKINHLSRLVGFLVVGLTFSTAAYAWVPISCEDRASEVRSMRQRAEKPVDFHAVWEKYEKQVRAAAPGDSKYVPYPYPKSPSDVFEDFRYAFLNRLVTDTSQIAPRHQSTYDALQNGDFDYKVVRVENWSASRCGTTHPAPYYHLVRLFDGAGREISRTAINANGIFSIFAELDGRQPALDDLSSMGSTVHERFGIEAKPTQTQYVTTDGLPVRCSPIVPCPVFRSEGATFLVNHDYYLFRIAPDAPGLSVQDLAHRPIDPLHRSVNAGRRTTPWISVGYGALEGRLVAVGPKGENLE